MVAFDPDAAAAAAALSVFRRRFSFVASYGERERKGERWDRAIKEQRTYISFRGKFSTLALKAGGEGGLWIVGMWVNRMSVRPPDPNIQIRVSDFPTRVPPRVSGGLMESATLSSSQRIFNM